jgi:hypothetical protein
MNKIFKIIIFTSLLGILLTIVFYFAFLFSSHSTIIKNSDNLSEAYSNYSIEKEGFVLKTKVIQIGGVNNIGFVVYRSDDNTMVFDSYDGNNKYKWRLVDFDSISFSSDSLDIIVKSNDTGTFIFSYDGHYGWECR